ncbi:MAG: TonB-dependent receptor [Agarilytica sp.]
MKPLPSILITTSIIATTTSAIASTPRASETHGIEEVIVTAQKRQENLYSVPIAIDIIDGEFIDKNGAIGLSELEYAIPSLNFGRGGRRTRGEIAIRGVGGFARNIGSNGRVAVYIDDIPLGRSTAFDSSLVDIKQVEVLKGPQGTLFGANTIAGAINITTKSPTDTLAYGLQIDTGDRGYGVYSVKTNIPFNERFFGRLQLTHREFDGHIRNTFNNEKLQGSDLDAGRLSLLFNANENLSLRASLDWLEDNASATNAEALGNAAFSTTFGTVPLSGFSAAPNSHQVAHDADEFENRKVWGGSLKVTYTLDSDSEIVSITGYRDSEFQELSEEDYSSISFATSTFDEDYSQLTQEFRFASATTKQFDYVVGVFLQSNEIRTGRSANLFLSPTITLSANTPGDLKSTSYALFGNMNYHMTNRLTLTFGSRLQKESKKIDYTIVDTTGNFTNGNLQDKDSSSVFIPKTSINYSMSDNALLYASLGRGFKSGGWNADFVTSLDGITFDHEYSINYEIGYKNKILDNRASILAAVFHTDYTDLQVSQFISESGANEITNAGEANTEGLELELKYYVNENINVDFNTSYTQSEYTDFKDGGGPGIDYDGNKLSYAPEFSAFTSLNIQHPTSSKSNGYFHINYSYSDGYYAHPQNDDTLDKVGSSFRVNGYIGINFNDVLDVSLWVKNLTNETSLRFRGLSFLGVPRGYYEEPRTVGLSLQTNFE